MQAPAHTTLQDQGIGADQQHGLGPIQRPKQQHASCSIAIATLAISPVTAAGLVTSAFQGFQPGQVRRDHRIELRLGHDPLFQLHKPRHGARSSVHGLEAREDGVQKYNPPGVKLPQERLHQPGKCTSGLAIEHNWKVDQGRGVASESKAENKLATRAGTPRRISVTLSYAAFKSLGERSLKEGRSISNLAAFLIENGLVGKSTDE